MHAKPLRAALFNHTTLFDTHYDDTRVNQIGYMLKGLRDSGLAVVVLSTHEDPLASLRDAYGSVLNLTLSKKEVGKNKGSPAWVRTACEKLGITPDQVFYVGDAVGEWRTAINTPAFYLDAGWSPRDRGGREYRALSAAQPSGVLLFAQHVLAPAPLWAYARDFEDEPVRLRALLPSNVRLSSDNGEFAVQDVFTYGKEIRVASLPANTMLLALVVVSLLREGIFETLPGRPMPIFAPYPGSSRGSRTRLFDEPFKLLASYAKGYYYPDLFVRKKDAEDKSLVRWRHSQDRSVTLPTIKNEVGTLILNEKYKEKVQGRRVVVLDDFMTTGMSLEWAKALLLSAGAVEVVMVAVGKYPKPHSRYRFEGSINPYDLDKNQELRWDEDLLTLESYDGAVAHTRRAFRALARP